jgi:hypothetical protein
MYLEGSGRRFLLSAKSFDVGKYYISGYEGFPNMDSKPKCGYVARVERQKDSSFLVCLDYCHLCDQKLGQFCCGRSRTEREVVAKISHTVKRYRKVNMEFRCITVTIPTISKSGTRKVWCPRSFRKVNASLPNSADVNEALSSTPKMGMKLVSKLPEWNDEAKNLVVRFQGSGRILVASAKNFLLYEDKYSMLDFAEQSLSHIEEPASKGTSTSNSIAESVRSGAGKTAAVAGQSKAPEPVALERSQSEHTQEDDVDLEAVGGSVKGSPVHSNAKAAVLSKSNVDKLKRDPSSELDAGDEASRSSKASSRRAGSSSSRRADGSSEPRRSSRDKDKDGCSKDKGGEGEDGAPRIKKSSSRRKMAETESNGSTSPKVSPRRQTTSSTAGSTTSSHRREKEAPGDAGSNNNTSPEPEWPVSSHVTVFFVFFPPCAVERSVLQFGKSTATRFVLDFKYPLSPLQAFGIAISAFASDEITDAPHEVNHMASPLVSTRKQLEFVRTRSNTITTGHSYSPLKSPFATPQW